MDFRLLIFLLSVVVMGLAIMLAYPARYSRDWFLGASLMTVFLLLGVANTCFYQYRIDRSTLTPNRYTYIARILHTPVKGIKGSNIPLMVVSYRQGDEWIGSRYKILGFLETKDSLAELLPGDLIVASSDIREVLPPMNPGEFNYRLYLRRSGIAGQTYVSSDQWSVIGHHRGSRITRISAMARNHLLSVYQKNGIAGNSYEVLAALTLGYRDDLSDEMKASFTDSGTIHVLAVSGLHVGIVYLFFSYLLSFLSVSRLGRQVRPWLLVGILWFFAILTGMAPSVQRAATMFSFIALGNVLKRETNIYNTLAVSALFLLLVNPLVLTDPGCQLSYMAVTGIVYFHPRIYGLWRPKYKLIDWVWTLLSVTFYAQLSTLPLSLLYFRQFPVYFLPANLVVIPLSTLILYLGITTYLISFWPWLTKMMCWLLGHTTDLLVGTVKLVDQLPGAVIRQVDLSVTGTLLLYLLLICSSAFLFYHSRRAILATLFVLCLFLIVTNIRSAIAKRDCLTVYRVPGKSFICISSQQKSKVFCDMKNPGEWKRMEYYSKSDWIKKRIRLEETTFLLLPGESPAERRERFIRGNKAAWNYGFISLNDLRIMVLGEPWQNRFKSNRTIPVDCLVVTHNMAWDDRLMNIVQPAQVVLDSSVSGLNSSRWLKECGTRNIPCHEVINKGSYVLNIN
jgi:competence protein ComEC